MADKKYTVNAKLLAVKLNDGGEVYLNEGATLPTSAAADNVNRLLRLALIDEASEAPEAGKTANTPAPEAGKTAPSQKK